MCPINGATCDFETLMQSINMLAFGCKPYIRTVKCDCLSSDIKHSLTDCSSLLSQMCLHIKDQCDIDVLDIMQELSKQFVLCAERVGQMTKTYNDIEAVTRLLEEKERDLELAARIGQTLLEKNKEIQTRNEQLEDSLVESNEKVKQLNHDLTLKTSLLQVYTHDEAELESATPVEEPVWNQGLKHLDCLSKKVKVLEEENFSLRQETSQLKVDTTELEEAEDHLVKNVLFQIQDANEQIKMLQEELGDKCEVTLRQQEEIGNLMGKIVMVEGQVKKMALENAELQQHLNAAVDSQRQLTSELSELTDKYHECLALLQETQEDMKDLQKSRRPSVARPQYGMYNPFLPEGSLASELEDSLKKEMDYPMGYSPDERRTHNRRVMDTARAVRRRRKSYGLLSVPGSSPTSGNESCESIAGSSNRSSIYMSDDSFLESEADSSYGSVASALGKPGIPGSNDLETALRRLSMRKANEINEQFLKQEEERKLCKRSLGSFTPTGEHTPESMMSTGSGSNMSEFSRLSGLSFRIPEKLQIVKPIEGSLTLHQWQRLATPHLSGFLDPRPGVQNKGERPLDLEEEEVYDMSDIEEDCPGTCVEESTPDSKMSRSGLVRYCASAASGDSGLASLARRLSIKEDGGGEQLVRRFLGSPSCRRRIPCVSQSEEDLHVAESEASQAVNGGALSSSRSEPNLSEPAWKRYSRYQQRFQKLLSPPLESEEKDLLFRGANNDLCVIS